VGATAFGKNERQVFTHDPAAGTVLALLGDPAEPAASAGLLAAARDALRTGRLVVAAPGPGLTGLCATLHAEHPALGITLVQVRGPPRPGRRPPVRGRHTRPVP
jgi:hypothetical protein